MRARRPRRYIAPHWLLVARAAFRYSHSRDAFVLRMVGRKVGPVLRPERRVRRYRPPNGVDRRRRSGRRATMA